MSKHNHDELTRLADELGKSAMQMQDALKQLLQLYIEHQKARQAEQAELRKQFAKQLKENGFDPSPDNVKAFEAHVKEVRSTEKELAKVDADIAKLEKSAELKPEKAAKLEDLKLKRLQLAEKLEDLQDGVGLESQLKPDPNAQILRKVQGKKTEAAAPEGVNEAPAGPVVDAAVAAPPGPELDAAAEAPPGPEVDAAAEQAVPGWNRAKAEAKGPAEKAPVQAPKLGGYRAAPGEKGVQAPDAGEEGNKVAELENNADPQNELKVDDDEPAIEVEGLQNDALPGKAAAEPEAPAIQPKRGRAATMPAAPKAGQGQEGATRMFRANSVGAKLMETKSLSPQAQWVAGIVSKQADALGQNQNVALGRKR